MKSRDVEVLVVPRVLTATEADGRTYVALLERSLSSLETDHLVIFDLSACRSTAP